VGRVQVQDHGHRFYPVFDTPAVLAWLGQVSALELHVPQWRFGAPTGPRDTAAASSESGWPDRVVFDCSSDTAASCTDTCGLLTVAPRPDGKADHRAVTDWRGAARPSVAGYTASGEP